MKKLLATLIAVVLCLSLCVPVMAEETYNVGICQLVQHPALDAATQGFMDTLAAKLGDKNPDFLAMGRPSPFLVTL